MRTGSLSCNLYWRVLSDMYSDIRSGILFWASTWHSTWKRFWFSNWQTLWHLWHLSWHTLSGAHVRYFLHCNLNHALFWNKSDILHVESDLTYILTCNLASYTLQVSKITCRNKHPNHTQLKSQGSQWIARHEPCSSGLWACRKFSSSRSRPTAVTCSL